MRHQAALSLRAWERRPPLSLNVQAAVRELARQHPQWTAHAVYEEFTAICPRCCGPMAEKEASRSTKVCKDLGCGLELSYWTVYRLLGRRCAPSA